MGSTPGHPPPLRTLRGVRCQGCGDVLTSAPSCRKPSVPAAQTGVAPLSPAPAEPQRPPTFPGGLSTIPPPQGLANTTFFSLWGAQESLATSSGLPPAPSSPAGCSLVSPACSPRPHSRREGCEGQGGLRSARHVASRDPETPLCVLESPLPHPGQRQQEGLWVQGAAPHGCVGSKSQVTRTLLVQGPSLRTTATGTAFLCSYGSMRAGRQSPSFAELRDQ